MTILEFVIKIYDDHGRLKLPSSIVRKLNLRKNTILRVSIKNGVIILEPIRAKWPKKGKIDEDKALSEKHLAWFEI
ncbi:hypothetical protein DRJ19_04550 [Candidatus Woesearchaeota archaeon]|nr:MAG: hypothetical protein DRJ19_04550 [Candidatus Woesearchaeota archaeon]